MAEIIGSEDLDSIFSAYRYIGEASAGIANQVDVISDRASIKRLNQAERRFGCEHLGLTDIF